MLAGSTVILVGWDITPKKKIRGTIYLDGGPASLLSQLVPLGLTLSMGQWRHLRWPEVLL